MLLFSTGDRNDTTRNKRGHRRVQSRQIPIAFRHASSKLLVYALLFFYLLYLQASRHASSRCHLPFSPSPSIILFFCPPNKTTSKGEKKPEAGREILSKKFFESTAAAVSASESVP